MLHELTNAFLAKSFAISLFEKGMRRWRRFSYRYDMISVFEPFLYYMLRGLLNKPKIILFLFTSTTLVLLEVQP
jgi:hypothetical protein